MLYTMKIEVEDARKPCFGRGGIAMTPEGKARQMIDARLGDR